MGGREGRRVGNACDPLAFTVVVEPMLLRANALSVREAVQAAVPGPVRPTHHLTGPRRLTLDGATRRRVQQDVAMLCES